ncbi:MAG: hypothetical protein V3V14_01215 [Saprospiraceae bacterium]
MIADLKGNEAYKKEMQNAEFRLSRFVSKRDKISKERIKMYTLFNYKNKQYKLDMP